MSVSLVEPDWPAPPGIRVATTCRTGGVSAGPYRSLNLGAHVGDRQDAVAENRRRVAAQLSLPAEPQWLQQVHGTAVARDLPPAQGGADALVTDRPGVVAVVLTADCLPIVLAAADGSEVAVAHAGWRGLVAGITEATVDAMHAPGAELLAWLGPAISQAHFEVGEEVRAAFVAADPNDEAAFQVNARGRFQADLYALARQRLAACGVTRIHGGDHCSFADDAAFFSYRRDGECGRMATLVWRETGQ